MSKTIGKVKIFNPEKGFGFINIEGEERDIFFHYSQIMQDGFKTVDIDQEVEFDLVEGEKGLQAHNIVKL
ncbi:MAG: cold-shock protein [Coprobacillaceae bacterium]